MKYEVFLCHLGKAFNIDLKDFMTASHYGDSSFSLEQ